MSQTSSAISGVQDLLIFNRWRFGQDGQADLGRTVNVIWQMALATALAACSSTGQKGSDLGWTIWAVGFCFF